MVQDFVSYESAIKLREIGFTEPCLRVGNPHGHTMWKWYEVDADTVTVSVQDVLDVKYGSEWVEIPTFSQAFRWFREKHKLDSTVALVATGYGFYIHKNRNYTNKGENYGMCITYEEAELACLEKLIETYKKD